jgi:hypothetical protein
MDVSPEDSTSAGGARIPGAATFARQPGNSAKAVPARDTQTRGGGVCPRGTPHARADVSVSARGEERDGILRDWSDLPGRFKPKCIVLGSARGSRRGAGDRMTARRLDVAPDLRATADPHPRTLRERGDAGARGRAWQDPVAQPPRACSSNNVRLRGPLTSGDPARDECGGSPRFVPRGAAGLSPLDNVWPRGFPSSRSLGRTPRD